jgi:hypothetical protein
MHHKKDKNENFEVPLRVGLAGGGARAGFLFIRLALGRTWPYLGRAP